MSERKRTLQTHITKVAIIGAGAVGATVAFSLVVKGVAAQIALIDINGKKAMGEALDMQHSMDFQRRNVGIVYGGYEECSDADIVVITAAAPYAGEKDRLQMLDKTAGIMHSVVDGVMKSGFDGIFIVVSNPVDVMSYLVRELSGLPKSRVIGTGTILESARLKQEIGQLMGMDPRSVDACVMGEHGNSMMIPWSHVRAGGKLFYQVLEDNPELYADVRLEDLTERTKQAGNVIMEAKDNTQYGIAGAVTGIVTAILQNENKIYPVSACLEGEYGISGIYCGVPAILDRTGIRDIGTYHLTEQEMEELNVSAEVIRNGIRRLH